MMLQQSVKSSEEQTSARNSNFDRTGLAKHCETLYRRVRTLMPECGAESISIGLTSCWSNSGVSTLARGLAQTVDINGDRALLVDANLVNPVVASEFGVSSSPGLMDLLSSQCALEEAVHETKYSGLHVLPAGAKNSPASFSPDAVQSVLKELSSDYSLIVVDLPIAVETSVCFDIAGSLDAVLLVVEAERGQAELASRAKSQLVNAGANLLGVVLNKK